MLISQRLFELCSGQKESLKNNTKPITQKIIKGRVTILCTALLLNEIYPPMKFQVDTSNTF
jgi:hypothetical protein